MHALTTVLLALAASLYGLGVLRLWARAGRGHGISTGHVGCFVLGLFVVGFALLSPLHHYAERRLWVHMVQHELLMVVAAPLIVYGRPFEAWAWAAPALTRRLLPVRRLLADTVVAWTIHAVAVWGWHAPYLFERAVREEWLHVAQHASFFLPAVAFWWSVLNAGTRVFPTVLSLFTTMLHTGALGALMALSPVLWYAGYTLEDQQLAGVIMWVPAAVAYPLAALMLVGRSLRQCAA